jgi:hypothetical protein
MINNKSTSEIVGPIDRIFRFFIGLMILITAYVFDVHIVEFAVLHVICLYFWLSMLLGWDPFYGVIFKIRRFYLDHRGMNGNF